MFTQLFLLYLCVHVVCIRELEGLIFQCGLRMEELKEQGEQMQQEQPTCEAPPSPPRHPTPLSVPSEGGETLNHPQVHSNSSFGFGLLYSCM